MVEQLFKNIYLNPITVVWGNLGRYHSHLSYYLDICFSNSIVHIYSDLWDQTYLHKSFEDDKTQCDILIWIEPNFRETIRKPIYANSMIVLTSHLNLVIPKNVKVIAHHMGILLPFPSSNFKGFVEFHQSNDSLIIKPTPFWTIEKRFPDIFNKVDVIVDLIECQFAREAYLSLLNVIDYLALKGTLIKSWKVILPLILEISLQKNLKHKQNNIDGDLKRYYYHLFTNTSSYPSV